MRRFRAVLVVLAAVAILAAARGALWAAGALFDFAEPKAGAADLENEVLWKHGMD